MQRQDVDTRGLVAYGLMGLGGLFLTSQIFSFDVAAWVWPWFVIIPGVPFLWFALDEVNGKPALIFPGLLISGTGLLLLYQSVTGHWESWTYAWLMYPLLVGLGLQFQGKRNDMQAEVAVGKVMTGVSAFMLVSCGLMFEVLFFSGLSGWVWPLVLIAVGWMLLDGRNGGKSVPPGKRKNKNTIYVKPKRGDDDPHDEKPLTLRERIDAALNEDEDGGPIVV